MGEVVDGSRRDPRIWGKSVMDLGSSAHRHAGSHAVRKSDRGQGWRATVIGALNPKTSCLLRHCGIYESMPPKFIVSSDAAAVWSINS